MSEVRDMIVQSMKSFRLKANSRMKQPNQHTTTEDSTKKKSSAPEHRRTDTLWEYLTKGHCPHSDLPTMPSLTARSSFGPVCGSAPSCRGDLLAHAAPPDWDLLRSGAGTPVDIIKSILQNSRRLAAVGPGREQSWFWKLFPTCIRIKPCFSKRSGLKKLI